MAGASLDQVMAGMQELFTRPDGLKMFLELVANVAMRAEASAHVWAAPHERSDERRGHRNSYKPRAAGGVPRSAPGPDHTAYPTSRSTGGTRRFT